MRKFLPLIAVAAVAVFAYRAAHAETPVGNAAAIYGANVGNYPLSYVKGCQLTCGNTATAILCSSPGFTVRQRVITNTSDTDIYIGNAGVTNAAGYLLKVGTSLTLNIDPNATTALVIDCAVSGGSKALSVLEGG